ncbi:hypothetical protein ACE6H2_026822 [Prunus campanulata]
MATEACIKPHSMTKKSDNSLQLSIEKVQRNFHHPKWKLLEELKRNKNLDLNSFSLYSSCWAEKLQASEPNHPTVTPI